MLRMLMGICALCAASVSAHSDEFTFRVKSLYQFSAQIKYYSQKRNDVWPGATTHWPLADDEVHEHTLTCTRDDSICFGAGNPGNLEWGVGLQGKSACDNCCFTCKHGEQTPVIILSTVRGLGKNKSRLPRITLDSSQDIKRGVPGKDLPGGDFARISANSSLACQNSCAGEPRCKAWTWKSSSQECWLKSSVPDLVDNSCCVSAEIDQFTKEEMSKEYDTDRPGADIRNFPVADSSACQKACVSNNRCRSWSFVRPTKKGENGGCFLKGQIAQAVFKSGVISGVKYQRANF